jgi:hypothetical protein
LIIAATEPFSVGGGAGIFIMVSCAAAMPVQSATPAIVAVKRFMSPIPFDYRLNHMLHSA